MSSKKQVLIVIRVCLLLQVIVGITAGKSLEDELNDGQSALEILNKRLEDVSNDFLSYQQQAGVVLIQAEEEIDTTGDQVHSEAVELKQKVENDGKNVSECFAVFEENLQLTVDEGHENLEGALMEFVTIVPMQLYGVKEVIDEVNEMLLGLIEELIECQRDEKCIDELKSPIDELITEISRLPSSVDEVEEFVKESGVKLIADMQRAMKDVEHVMLDLLYVNFIKCIDL